MTMQNIYPTRILHVMSGLNMGGIETIVTSLYQHVNKEKIQFDFVLHVNETQHYTDLVKSLGAQIYVAPQPKKVGLIRYILWWNQFFKEHKQYSIVHGHVPTYASIYLGIAKKNKCTTICHCHTAFPTVKGMTKIIRSLLHYPLRWVADYHFACSIPAGEYLYGKKIIHSPNFQIIKNARDTRLFVYQPNIRQILREKLGINEFFVVGHIGRLVDVKNHVFLFKIFSAIYKKNSRTRLLLVGDGPLKEQLVHQIKVLGIEKVVIFANNVSNPQDYYQSSMEHCDIRSSQVLQAPALQSDLQDFQISFSSVQIFDCLSEQSVPYYDGFDQSDLSDSETSSVHTELRQ